ncbi:MAG TPA: hypothetical protein VIW69_03230 [Candidatus Elarobacter sp.]
MTCRALAAAALLTAVAACANHRDVALQPAASPASAYDVALRAKGAQLAAQDRAGAERRRAEIARVVSGSARDVTPPGAMAERFIVQLRTAADVRCAASTAGSSSTAATGCTGWHWRRFR